MLFFVSLYCVEKALDNRYETCVTLGSGGGRAGTARTRNDGTCVHMK